MRNTTLKYVLYKTAIQVFVLFLVVFFVLAWINRSGLTHFDSIYGY